MIRLRASTDQDIPCVMDIWRRAVDATHDFLAPRDRREIEAELAALFPRLTFVLAVDPSDMPQGFMLLNDRHLDALFVDPDQHGQGIGKALIRHALAAHPGLSVDVNEQNPKALGFYEGMGFQRIGRSGRDGQGRPYPLIHLRHMDASETGDPAALSAE